jgi:hypothetical protein
MIYEIRTYNLKPRAIPEYWRRFGEKLQGRREFSELGGHWYTDVGPLNQLVAIWPYEDLGQRARIRIEAEASGKWPPDTGELIVSMKSEIYLPAPFMTPLGDRNIGPIYEMRLYTYAPEAMPQILKAWGDSIVEREKLSPLAGCWYSEYGGLNNFIHMWAYRTADERLRIREESRVMGIWPPPGCPLPVAQENKILLPAPFSPMQ